MTNRKNMCEKHTQKVKICKAGFWPSGSTVNSQFGISIEMKIWLLQFVGALLTDCEESVRAHPSNRRTSILARPFASASVRLSRPRLSVCNDGLPQRPLIAPPASGAAGAGPASAASSLHMQVAASPAKPEEAATASRRRAVGGHVRSPERCWYTPSRSRR